MFLHSLTTVAVAVFLGLLATFAASVRRRDGAAIVNAIVVIGVSLVPILTFSTVDTQLGSKLTVWLALAGFLHMVGMLGVYESVWWWDHLTHTVSAALVAALCYGGVLAVSDLSPLAVTLVVGAFTLVAGIFWELLELVARALGQRYDIEPVLVHYGWDDTAFDLVFDGVGAAVVLAVDIDIFAALATRWPDATRTLLVSAGVVITVGSLAIATVLTAIDEWPELNPG